MRRWKKRRKLHVLWHAKYCNEYRRAPKNTPEERKRSRNEYACRPRKLRWESRFPEGRPNNHMRFQAGRNLQPFVHPWERRRPLIEKDEIQCQTELTKTLKRLAMDVSQSRVSPRKQPLKDGLKRLTKLSKQLGLLSKKY